MKQVAKIEEHFGIQFPSETFTEDELNPMISLWDISSCSKKEEVTLCQLFHEIESFDYVKDILTQQVELKITDNEHLLMLAVFAPLYINYAHNVLV